MGIMRRFSLFTLLCFAFPFFGYSQFGNESSIPYFRYSVTGGLGVNQLFGDLDKRQIGGGVYLRGNYFLTHGVSVGLELQEGLLRGKDNVAVNGVTRKAVNLYHAAILGIRFQPIKYFQDDHLRRIEYRESFGKRALNSVYVGAGMGMLYSLQWDGQRTNPDDAAGSGGTPTDADLMFYGRKHSLSYLVSTNAGIELPLHSLKPNLLDSYVWNLIINGQLNFSLDDELDGYSGDYAGNEHRDVYALLSLGINLRF